MTTRIKPRSFCVMRRRILWAAVTLYAVVSAVSLIVLHQRAHETSLTTDNKNTQQHFPLPRPVQRIQKVVPPQSKAAKPGLNEALSTLSLTETAAAQHQEPEQPVAAAAASLSTRQEQLFETKQQQQQQQQQNKFDRNTWTFDQEAAQSRLTTLGAASIRQPITAYVEGASYPPNEAIVSMGNRGDMKNDKDVGEPIMYKTPLPLRTQTPNELQKVVYSRVQTCHDMPQGFPVDQGLQFDDQGQPIVWNVGDTATPEDFPQQELPFCPVESDPYLPWIHDLFPSPDGTLVHILAQNKRRCRTGKKFTENVNRLLPQVALMQPVSVQRVTEQQARSLAPDLWHDNDDDENNNHDTSLPRYQYVPLEQASPEGKFTRFICRFHSLDFATGKTIVLDETLSAYPFNYELAAYRKGHVNLHTPKGKDSKYFWTSNLHFTCPVPERLQTLVKDGTTVLPDGTPTLWLDIVPMRTPARYKRLHFGTDTIGPFSTWTHDAQPWNVTEEMGEAHVLPAVSASGRWANLPICPPHKPPNVPKTVTEAKAKPHYLSACLWASAEFKTRGVRKGGNSDTLQRLKEWLTFHFQVGFEHVYVYDNSAAHTNSTNLEPILQLFGDRVTRIDWPSIVCNNNIPAHDSTGERSSQYAAENSCRARYAPFTEWIASFDTDEYFVPMGKYTNLRDLLRDAEKGGTNILSFRSSRGKMRQEYSFPDGKGRLKLPNATFLDTYNCDSAGSPKPSWADRARKQIYRADYVLYHYVHYSTVTQGHTRTYADGYTKARFAEHKPSERVVDEENEAVLVHTKTIPQDMTNFYDSRCRNDYGRKWQGCWVAYPWPNGKRQETVEDANGMEYNCFINPVVENYWGPKLRDAMQSASTELSS